MLRFAESKSEPWKPWSKLRTECFPRCPLGVQWLLLEGWPLFPFTSVCAICRYPTGLATNESGTRRILASFRKKPTSMPQRLPWRPHTLSPPPFRTTRPIHPPRQILVRTGRSLPTWLRQPCATKRGPTGQDTAALLRTQWSYKGRFILKRGLILGPGE